MLPNDFIEIRKIEKELSIQLALFFEELIRSGDHEYFHPHPFTPEQVNQIVGYEGADLYFALVKGSNIIGYGILRGWDEGYSIPSLGIIIQKNMRGKGFGKLLMHFLHIAAKERGANQIRIKVYPDNIIAKNLYESMGYIFEKKEDDQLVGLLII